METDTAIAIARLDKVAFAQCFNRLAKAKRAKDIDAADMQVYYTVLQGFSIWAVEEAARELQSRPTFGFPESGVWFQAAQEEVQRRQREQLRAPREWKAECRDCRDSGWREHVCESANRCGRRFCSELGEKHEHTYYSVCPCREHNSTYRRNTQASQLGHGEKS